AGHAERPGRAYRLHERVEHNGGLLGVAGVPLRLVADGVDALVRALAAGQLLDLGSRLAGGEVDRYGPDGLGLGQPLGNPVDGEHRARAAQQRRIGGHQAYRPRAVHGHRLAGADIRQLTAVVSGREYVREQGIVRLVLGSRRQLQAIEIGERDSQIFCLATWIRTHRDISVGASRESRIHGQAEPGVACLAVLAEPAGHVEWHDHAVAYRETRYPGTGLHDDAQVLVPEYDAGLRRGHSLVHVQVRAADAA